MQRKRGFSAFELFGALLAIDLEQFLAPGDFLIHRDHFRVLWLEVLSLVLHLRFEHQQLLFGAKVIRVGGGLPGASVGSAASGRLPGDVLPLQVLIQGQGFDQFVFGAQGGEALVQGGQVGGGAVACSCSKTTLLVP